MLSVAIALGIGVAIVGVAAVVAAWDIARRVLLERAERAKLVPAAAAVDGAAIERRQMDWEAKHSAQLAELGAKLSELEGWRREANLSRLGGRRG